MEKFFKEVDISGDGKVSNLEINEYISKKLALRSEHEHKQHENAEKDIDEHIESIFEKLGTWYYCRYHFSKRFMVKKFSKSRSSF